MHLVLLKEGYTADYIRTRRCDWCDSVIPAGERYWQVVVTESRIPEEGSRVLDICDACSVSGPMDSLVSSEEPERSAS